jgi:hypothetical protein
MSVTLQEITVRQTPPNMVQDNPKLPDDGGETPKSQGRGWRF